MMLKQNIQNVLVILAKVTALICIAEKELEQKSDKILHNLCFENLGQKL
jgi:hypothetical protein